MITKKDGRLGMTMKIGLGMPLSKLGGPMNQTITADTKTVLTSTLGATTLAGLENGMIAIVPREVSVESLVQSANLYNKPQLSALLKLIFFGLRHCWLIENIF